VKFQQVYAVVDKEYRLLWVGGEWDEFALGNAGKTSLADAILSTSLMAHVAGEDTRVLTARMIDTVMQARKPLRLEYRCDSPGMARKFLLTIQPMKGGQALMVHDLRDAWHFSPPLNPWQFDVNAVDRKCSFCGNVMLSGTHEWQTCDEIRDRHPTKVNYEVCETCQTAVADAIAEVEEQRETVSKAESGTVDR
jgi:hypothetical protein